MANQSQKLGGAFLQAGAFIRQNTVSTVSLLTRSNLGLLQKTPLLATPIVLIIVKINRIMQLKQGIS